MRKRLRIRLWPVCVLMAAALVAFLVYSNQLNENITSLTDQIGQAQERLTSLQNEQKALDDTLAVVDTDSYIENQARTLYGYMRPDEIRFVITNPETLYGETQEP